MQVFHIQVKHLIFDTMLKSDKDVTFLFVICEVHKLALNDIFLYQCLVLSLVSLDLSKNKA